MLTKNNFQKIISGYFGKKFLYFKFFKDKSLINNFFFAHGVFSSTLKERYLNLADLINKKKIGNVFLFESSRSIYTFESKINYDKYIENSFKGKSFYDEMSDFEVMFDEFKKKLSLQKSRIHIVGFSLGGTISTFLIKKYGNLIDNIFFFGSAVHTKRRYLPILSSYPEAKRLLANLSLFKGGVYMVQGTADDLVPQEDGLKILEASKDAKIRQHIILKGVDHRFRLIDGKPDEQKLIHTILTILKNGVNFNF